MLISTFLWVTGTGIASFVSSLSKTTAIASFVSSLTGTKSSLAAKKNVFFVQVNN